MASPSPPLAMRGFPCKWSWWRQIDMAEKLVAAMTSEWKPEKYQDEYYDAVMKYIKAKAEAGDTEVPPQGLHEEEEEDRKGIINIVDLLKKSVEQSAARKKPPAGRKTHKERDMPKRKRA